MIKCDYIMSSCHYAMNKRYKLHNQIVLLFDMPYFIDNMVELWVGGLVGTSFSLQQQKECN